MATYKVIQDIEAEDKLLGPLTLKQFIFAGIALTCAYLSFIVIANGLTVLLIFLVPPMLFTGFMAWPWSQDQPTEVWLLAKLRFLIKPRRRIWDQTGMKELVTITAPKKEEKIYTDGLSETEVKSRLQALANTIDSRGWAIKNINTNLFAQPGYATNQSSDRLIDLSMIPQEVSNADTTAADDILDEQNNPTAQHLEQMITQSTQTHRQRVVENMQHPDKKNEQPDYWFLNKPPTPTTSGYAVFDSSATVAPGTDRGPHAADLPKEEEEKLTKELKKKSGKPKAAYGHILTIDPKTGEHKGHKHEPPKTKPGNAKSQHHEETTMSQMNPDILNLANNSDLNVATIARQANKSNNRRSPDDDEVVIPLR